MTFGITQPGRAAILGGLLLWTSGCVSIYDDKVQVRRPEEVDIYQRNILDKCKPHQLPHRLIKATLTAGTTILTGEGVAVDNQANFDLVWNQLIPDLSGGATGDALKPNINWEVQTTRFLLIQAQNSCEKMVPYGMESDCYQINLPVFRFVQGTNCAPASSHPVFIYIYPKGNLPLVPIWLKSPYLTPTPSP